MLDAVRESTSGSCHLGAARRLSGLERESASCGGGRRLGAGREPPRRGQPRENLLRPNGQCLRLARPWSCATSGWAPEPALSPLGRDSRVCARGLLWRDLAVDVDTGPLGPRPAGNGLGLCSPWGGRIAAGPSPHPAGVPPPQVSRGRRGGGRRCSNALPSPGSPRRASRWGPSASGSLAPRPPRVDVVLPVPSEVTAVLCAQEALVSRRVDTSCSRLPHSRESLCPSCGAFSVAAWEQCANISEW